jgi:hypothetical protein
MYQRSYYQNDETVISPPREYDGSLNFEKEEQVCEERECSAECDGKPKRGVALPFFGKDALSFLHGFEIGLEEILIIGAAIFLLMSKSGDFECILILLSLLFVR